LRRSILPANTAGMFTALRRVGHFEKVIVHNSEATGAEFNIKINGHDCLKRLRFS
jgi:hypothetical protein